jgi:hypothetical protein
VVGEEVNKDRRRFLGVAAAAGAAATALPLLGAARAARASTQSAVTQPAVTQFGPVRQIKAGVLSTGYVEAGPADGPGRLCQAALREGVPVPAGVLGRPLLSPPPWPGVFVKDFGFVKG